GYYDGLFETLDGGITWDTLNFGRTFNRFFVLDSNHVYAAGRSVYRYGDSVNFTVTKDIARANPHKLYPVSPNPTTGKLNIKFDIGEYSSVMLQIVSLDAKKVFTVMNKRLPPGTYHHEWDGSNMPDGLYMVWL